MRNVRLCLVLTLAGCAAHRAPIEALDYAIAALAMQAVHGAEGSQDTTDSAIEATSFVPPSTEDELTDADAALMERILGTVFCGADVRAEVEWNMQVSQDACRSAWLSYGDVEGFNPALEAHNMLDAKVGYEQFIADCGGAPDRQEVAKDVYKFVWKPGNPDSDEALWGEAWDPCFGTPIERLTAGAVLEQY